MARKTQAKEAILTARDTIRGFLVGWVVEPLIKILETVRHGEDGTLAIMGSQSLKSDLDVGGAVLTPRIVDQYLPSHRAWNVWWQSLVVTRMVTTRSK